MINCQVIIRTSIGHRLILLDSFNHLVTTIICQVIYKTISRQKKWSLIHLTGEELLLCIGWLKSVFVQYFWALWKSRDQSGDLVDHLGILSFIPPYTLRKWNNISLYYESSFINNIINTYRHNMIIIGKFVKKSDNNKENTNMCWTANTVE